MGRHLEKKPNSSLWIWEAAEAVALVASSSLSAPFISTVHCDPCHHADLVHVSRNCIVLCKARTCKIIPKGQLLHTCREKKRQVASKTPCRPEITVIYSNYIIYIYVLYKTVCNCLIIY